MSFNIDPAELMETQSDINALDEMADLGADREECLGDEDHEAFTDVEADSDALASAGMGTDEDYWSDTPLGEDYGGE